MEEVTVKGKVQRWAAETIMPLSVTFNAAATAIFYAFSVTFSSRLFGLAIDEKTMILIALGSTLQAICSSGLPALANLGTMAMIFGALGLPVEVVSALVVITIPFLNPFISATNVMTHAWSVSILERRNDPNARETLQATV